MQNDILKLNSIPETLKIGEYYIFPDMIKIAGNSIVNEQASVSGNTIITNKTIKNTSVTFIGRLVKTDEYANFVLYIENVLKAKIISDIVYSEFYFKNCSLKLYSADISENIAEIKLLFMVEEILPYESKN